MKTLHAFMFVFISLCILAHQAISMTPGQRSKISSPPVVEGHIRWGKERQLIATSQLVEGLNGAKNQIRAGLRQVLTAKQMLSLIIHMTPYKVSPLWLTSFLKT